MKSAESQKKKPVKKNEKLSRRDQEELITMKVSTYTRGRGGGIRRK